METQNNYLNFLKDLKLFCDFEKTISIQNLAKKHELKYYGHISKILFDNGLIKKTNTYDSYSPYLWNTIDPNIHMAKELEKRVNDIRLTYNEKYHKKAKTKSLKTTAKNKELKELQNLIQSEIFEKTDKKTKSTNNLHLDTITFKIFWTTITVKLNYKTIK